MYEYGARLVRVVDADTWRVDIDLGMRIWMHSVAVRAKGVNSPEMSTDEGRMARSWVVAWFVEHCPEQRFTLHTVLDRQDKYGRILGTVVAPDGHVLNDDLIVFGHAESY